MGEWAFTLFVLVGCGSPTDQSRADRIDVRFQGALCYIDAYRGATPEPWHLVRPRYFGSDDRWSLAFYTYSHERYEPSVFADGSFHGTPEDAVDIGAIYLQD